MFVLCFLARETLASDFNSLHAPSYAFLQKTLFVVSQVKTSAPLSADWVYYFCQILCGMRIGKAALRVLDGAGVAGEGRCGAFIAPTPTR